MSHTVLLVDDDPQVLSGLSRILHKEPYRLLTATSAEEAARILTDESVDLIVCDEQMPGMRGTEFLAGVARDYPDIVRIVLTGQPSLTAALRAINEGRVYHFFTKPCNEIELALTIRHALEQKDLLQKSRELLEITKRQSVLIDEARILRRMRDSSRRERAIAIRKGDAPADRRELLDEMEQAIQQGRQLLSSVKRQCARSAHADEPDTSV